MATPTNLVGQTVAGYRVESLLGKGGMGSVFRAVQVESDTPVALKVLELSSDASADVLRRFEREARALSELEHPHIVRFHGELIRDAERAYYAMELLEGQSLAQLLKARGKLAPNEAGRVTLDVLAALEAAHGQGMVHRDVKPANVVVGRDGLTKVIDFGLAAVADATRLTQTGSALGTPIYMSPEQAQGKPTDARSDLYSVAVLLYEALAGNPPFQASSPLVVLKQHIEQPPPALPPGLPAGLEGVVRMGLAKDPAARFGSADEFAQALQAVLGELAHAPVAELFAAGLASTALTLPAQGGALAETRPSPAPSAEPERAKPSRVTWVLVALASITIGARALALAQAARVSPEPPQSPSVAPTGGQPPVDDDLPPAEDDDLPLAEDDDLPPAEDDGLPPAEDDMGPVEDDMGPAEDAAPLVYLELDGGELYGGELIELTDEEAVLQLDDDAGELRVPRAKVTAIHNRE